MNYFKLNCDNVRYPVGQDMVLAKNMAKEACKVFIENIDTKEYGGICVYCTGSSGAILGSLFIGYYLDTYPDRNIMLYHVKKQGEHHHRESYNTIANSFNIIIDDCIDTGETFERVAKHVNKIDCLIVHNGWRVLSNESLSRVENIISYSEL